MKWNDVYLEGSLPWDTGTPDEHLKEMVNSGAIRPGKALEIGCGTGTNALWLARKGFEVTGVDLAPAAITLAEKKRKAAKLACVFKALDFLKARGLAADYAFVFDRGCFHVFDRAKDRAHFAAQVAKVLRPNGLWLSLIGSTEGGEREMGPPQRSAAQVVAAIEPYLEIVELQSTFFGTKHRFRATAWQCSARKRAAPVLKSA